MPVNLKRGEDGGGVAKMQHLLSKRPKVGRFGSLFTIRLFGDESNVVWIMGTAQGVRMMVVVLEAFQMKFFALISGVIVKLIKELRLGETLTFDGDVARAFASQENYQGQNRQNPEKGSRVSWRCPIRGGLEEQHQHVHAASIWGESFGNYPVFVG